MNEWRETEREGGREDEVKGNRGGGVLAGSRALR